MRPCLNIGGLKRIAQKAATSNLFEPTVIDVAMATELQSTNKITEY